MFYFMCVSFLFFSDVGSVLWTFGATVNIGYFWPRLVRQSMGIAISPVDNSLTKFSGGEPEVTKFLYLLTFFIVFELLTEGHVYRTVWNPSTSTALEKNSAELRGLKKDIVISLSNHVNPNCRRKSIIPVVEHKSEWTDRKLISLITKWVKIWRQVFY